MKKTAFLYAGQGSQYAGMGRDLYEVYPAYRTFFDTIELDFDIKEISFENPDGKLDLTEYTQPCLAAFACGVNQILREADIRPDYVCGLSLGEYSALNMADVWDAQQTVAITAYRGAVMAKASEGIESAMTAVIGLEEERVAECCSLASAAGVVSVCNYNCPGQIVIGGEKAAVKKAAGYAKERGAKRCLPLKVSGPFHTCLMKPAADALKIYFQDVAFRTPRIQVLYNCFGGPLTRGTISEALVRQVQEPVHMESILKYLFKNGVVRFVEIGPGTALSGFVKKTAVALGIGTDRYEVYTLETADQVRQALAALKQ